MIYKNRQQAIKEMCKIHQPEQIQLLRINDVGYVFRVGGEKALVMFKRELYHNFRYHFPDILKPSGTHYGYGQIMSRKMLEYACSCLDWVYFITEDGKVYRCRPMLFYKFYLKYHTDVPHLPGEVALPIELFERVHK